MKISKFVHKYQLNDCIAYYNSLRMKPVYLTFDQANNLENAIVIGTTINLDHQILNELIQYKILVDSDNGVIEKLRKQAGEPYVSIVYFILTEQCNLSCKYCFLGNSKANAKKITNYPMSFSTADQALNFFSYQTSIYPDEFDNEKEIIFYGGEPLLNYSTMKHVVEKAEVMRQEGTLSKKLSYSIVTNGLLLNEEIIDFLKKYNFNVAISIDGADEQANNCRVDKNGKPIFAKLIPLLKEAYEQGLRFGLSITLTENTLKNMDGLLRLIDELKVDSICFNILMVNEKIKVDDAYYDKATQFIIDFYKKTRSKGIYEDRIMRKVNAFMRSKVYYYDCAATSANQIVVTPDGGVGICHGCMEDRRYFITNVWDNHFDFQHNEDIQFWKRLSPIYRDECIDCPALGICGGGCPINAEKICNDISGIDTTFCVHAKKTLEFLINELYVMSTLEE